MKKRLSILAVLVMSVLVTAYSVSGTYAKYIAEVETSDSARVAKWVIGANEIKLFKDSYNENAVVGKNKEKVVAPGTKGSYAFTLNADVETAYTLKASITGETIAIIENNEGKNKIYEPIKFYFGTEEPSEQTEYTLSFEALKTKIAEIYDGSTVYPPTSLANANTHPTYYIGWSWEFEKLEGDEDNKVANVAVDTNDSTLGKGNDDNDILATDIEINVNITATQSATPAANIK